MPTTCILFEALKENSTPQKESLIKKTFLNAVVAILKKIIPKANPDYDDKIIDVRYWMVEFDDSGIPQREIGLDTSRIVIVKMPFRNNYGYWTDNNLKRKDFIHLFKTEVISQAEFEQQWSKIE